MKSLATIIFLVFTAGLSAQVQYGTIDYVRTSKMIMSSNIVDDELMKKIQQQMAASGAFTANFRATFAPDGFTFVEVPKETATLESKLAGEGVVMIKAGGENPAAFHTDTKAGKVINRNFIFDKGFLIEGTVEPLEWTLTGETVAPSDATIGLALKTATAVTPEGDTITAGFAPSLPVQVGPLNYHGLPGAIITLSIPGKNGGGTLYRATALSVSSKPLLLEKPTEGKKISPEKFRAEKAKRRKATKRQFREFSNN